MCTISTSGWSGQASSPAVATSSWPSRASEKANRCCAPSCRTSNAASTSRIRRSRSRSKAVTRPTCIAWVSVHPKHLDGVCRKTPWRQRYCGIIPGAMPGIDRRRFVGASAAGLIGLVSNGAPAAQGAREPTASSDAPADVTRALAAYVVRARPEDLPASVRTEACRTLLNWAGCAVGGSRHETVDIAVRALRPFSGPSHASLLGRGERMDVLHAALVNCISSHVLDFDDTHLKTVIHPAGPVASAILALAETRPVSGRDFLHALVLGAEVECRISNAVYPAHYDRGWHITGTTGVFGAAAAVGRVLGLNDQQMTWALGIAATQSSGLREMFGTMCKSFHPCRAAQNGAAAAFLAKAGFDSSERAIEAPRGFANVLSTKQDYAEIIDGLGARWE